MFQNLMVIKCLCILIQFLFLCVYQDGSDQTVILGAASMGIIQRDHQHNAVVYRTQYATNPFEKMKEDEEMEQRKTSENMDMRDVAGEVSYIDIVTKIRYSWNSHVVVCLFALLLQK